MRRSAIWGPTDEGVLTNLPPPTTVILRNVDGPSMVEYPYGDGKVIVSTLTFCTDALQATQGDALDNLLVYGRFFEGLARTPGFTVTPTPTPSPTPTGPTLTPSNTRTRPPSPTRHGLRRRRRRPRPRRRPTGPTSTETPTAIPSDCIGDCNGDGVVSIDDLTLTVAASMGDRGPRRLPRRRSR